MLSEYKTQNQIHHRWMHCCRGGDLCQTLADVWWPSHPLASSLPWGSGGYPRKFFWKQGCTYMHFNAFWHMKTMKPPKATDFKNFWYYRYNVCTWLVAEAQVNSMQKSHLQSRKNSTRSFKHCCHSVNKVISHYLYIYNITHYIWWKLWKQAGFFLCIKSVWIRFSQL